jgi:gliding motility-associated-like protein
VNVSPPATPTFNPIAPICSGGTITLPSTSINGFTGTWSPAVNNTATTTYTFTPTAGQCATTATLAVTVNPSVTPTFDPIAQICSGGTFTLPTTSTNGITGTWSPAINNSATTTYTFTPAAGQCASNTSLTVTVNSVNIFVNPNNSTIVEGESVVINASGGINYTWSPASGLSCTDCSSPIASPSTTTVYTVTGTDASGCTGVATVTIYITQVCGDLFVPNIFSPNDKGPTINNTLCVMGGCIAELTYAVYNRWGEKLFETTDTAQCWDGMYKDKPVNSGAYAYKLDAVLFDGTVIKESGNLTIVR